VRRLVYTASARRDLVSILAYITRESASLAAGRRFTGQIREKCTNLATLPGTMGRARPELRAEIRSYSFKGYVIFFRYVEHVLEVVNVLEGHRDIDRHFGGEETAEE
jgi:toxin ParE1/3/4